MKVWSNHALALLLSAHVVSATQYSPVSNNNYQVVVNPKSQSNFKKLDSSPKRTSGPKDRDFKDLKDVKELAKHARIKAESLLDRVRLEAQELYSKVHKNLQHYSKAEIGIYTSLACALTFALQAVFAESKTKSLDIAVINYVTYVWEDSFQTMNYQTVQELDRPKRTLKLYTSPSVFSSDGKTHVRLYKNMKRNPRSSSSSSPPPPTRPTQVQVSPVTAFYNTNDVDPASHNAIYRSMTPDMRQKLRVRRMRGGAMSSALMERLKIGFYFATWYALNIVYNIINKKVLNVLPAPLTVGAFQFGVGGLYCALVWLLGFRPFPKLTDSGKSSVNRVGLYHSLGQLASMISLGAGPVSFTHIVKAMEPFFSAIVSGLYFGKWMKTPVYLTLIPVVCGVGYACMKELNFSWLAFSAAMASNLAFALRAVMSKLALQSGASAGSNLTPPNMFGLVTWAAFVISIPIALFGEGKTFSGLWSAALNSVDDTNQFMRSLVLSGLFHYLNNEVMYLALGSVHPVTLAVGNTMKRVFILVASVMVFRNPISLQAGIGSGVGIAGVLLYSLTKQYYENLEAAEASKKKWGRKGKK